MSDAQQGQAPSEVFVICAARRHRTAARRRRSTSCGRRQGGTKPFRILVAKNGRGEFFSYRNVCPHQGAWLNFGAGTFFDETGALLKCGRHGAKFEVETGTCVSGACEGAKLADRSPGRARRRRLHPRRQALVEEDGLRGHWDDMDETMDITIHAS